MNFSEHDFSQIIFNSWNHFSNLKHKAIYLYTLTSKLHQARWYLAKYHQICSPEKCRHKWSQLNYRWSVWRNSYSNLPLVNLLLSVSSCFLLKLATIVKPRNKETTFSSRYRICICICIIHISVFKSTSKCSIAFQLQYIHL